MSLVAAGTIEIPDSPGTAFDHGAFEPESRRVFIAHMARRWRGIRLHCEGRNELAYCFSGITFLRRNRTDALGKPSVFRAFVRRGIIGG